MCKGARGILLKILIMIADKVSLIDYSQNESLRLCVCCCAFDCSHDVCAAFFPESVWPLGESLNWRFSISREGLRAHSVSSEIRNCCHSPSFCARTHDWQPLGERAIQSARICIPPDFCSGLRATFLCCRPRLFSPNMSFADEIYIIG